MEDSPTFMAVSRAPQTIEKYAHEAERWEVWLGKHKVTSYPADPFHVVLYIIHWTCGESSHVSESVVNAIYGMAWAHHIGVTESPEDRDIAQHPLQRQKAAGKNIYA